MKRVLMIAYHFPPFVGSSGVQRTVRFVQHLPKYGWEPMVLTVREKAYERTGLDLVGEIHPHVPVVRAFALDTARHLAVTGRYLRWAALPDRWVSWLVGAVPAGLRMVRKFRPQVLWSTYPIATAHLVGVLLAKFTGVPLVADFRDPMAQDSYPEDAVTRRVYWTLERHVVRTAQACVFTTPGAAKDCRERYPWERETKWWVIENGFDEQSFAEEERLARKGVQKALLRLVHSGHLYPKERNPLPFFSAVGNLIREGRLRAEEVEIVLRGSAREDFYAHAIREHGLERVVRLTPLVPYREAIREMFGADGLLLFQGPGCNHQIPAKAYEYIRVGRPVFVLGDSKGDTVRLLKRAGTPIVVVPLLDAGKISEGMLRFLDLVAQRPEPADASPFSREARARDLARLLDVVSMTRSE